MDYDTYECYIRSHLQSDVYRVKNTYVNYSNTICEKQICGPPCKFNIAFIYRDLLITALTG